MDRIRIRGLRPLSGRIAIGGAKNAALPLMVAGLLTAGAVLAGTLEAGAMALLVSCAQTIEVVSVRVAASRPVQIDLGDSCIRISRPYRCQTRLLASLPFGKGLLGQAVGAIKPCLAQIELSCRLVGLGFGKEIEGKDRAQMGADEQLRL